MLLEMIEILVCTSQAETKISWSIRNLDIKFLSLSFDTFWSAFKLKYVKIEIFVSCLLVFPYRQCPPMRLCVQSDPRLQKCRGLKALGSSVGSKDWGVELPFLKRTSVVFFAEIFVATRNGSLQTIAIIKNYRMSTLNVLKSLVFAGRRWTCSFSPCFLVPQSPRMTLSWLPWRYILQQCQFP